MNTQIKHLLVTEDVKDEIMIFKIKCKAKNASEVIKIAITALREKMEYNK